MQLAHANWLHLVDLIVPQSHEEVFTSWPRVTMELRNYPSLVVRSVRKDAAGTCVIEQLDSGMAKDGVDSVNIVPSISIVGDR
jgi:hypothetical protein